LVDFLQRTLQDKSSNRQTLMDDKLAQYKFRQWHFWWLVIFSFLLIITFVYYLPTRFLQQAVVPHDEQMPFDESQPHGHDASGNSIPIESGDGDHMIDEDMREHMDEMMEDHNDENVEHTPPLYQEEGNVKEGVSVNLNISPVPFRASIPLRLDFFVNQKPSNTPIPAKDLQIEHAKKMHVVGLRSDMNEFFHIHPEPATEEDAIFSINQTFNKPGMYKIWSSVLKDGAGYVFGHQPISIIGAGPVSEKKVFFDRNLTAGNYQVLLDTGGSIVKNREVILSFDIHTLTGQEVVVEDYLDAQMHLVLIKGDWSEFVHTHPSEADHGHSGNYELIETVSADEGHEQGTVNDEAVTFMVNFSTPGLYKGFAQFRPQGTNLPPDEAITAEFWVEVLEKSPSPISQWWGLLVVSAILIAGLSWLVTRYLKVKAEDIKINVK